MKDRPTDPTSDSPVYAKRPDEGENPLMKAEAPFTAEAQRAQRKEDRDMNNLTFRELATKNLSRAKRWHPEGIEEWSVNDWLAAFGGEAGEALNAGKKHRRILSKVQQHGDVPHDLSDAVDRIMEELADTVIYADLVAARLGRKLEDSIVCKFNQISVRERFPERLAAPDQA